MRSKWVGYAAALLLASAVVAASLFAPAALLMRRVSTLLGDVRYADYGNYPARTLALSPAPSPSPSAQPTAPADQTDSIYRKMVILEKGGGQSVGLPVTPPYDMEMMEAASRCVDILEEYMNAGVIPPLADFPKGFQLNASLLSTADLGGGEAFDYWSVSFTVDPNQKRVNGGVSVMLDARTGAIYSIKMYTASVLKTFHIEDSAKYIADTLHVTGAVRPTQTEPENQSAVWISMEKTLFITFYYAASSGGTSFTMACSVRSPY